MVGMTGHAVLLGQVLMEWGAQLARSDGSALGGKYADLVDRVARGAFFGRGTRKGLVTGEAVRCQLDMRRIQFPGADHPLRLGKQQSSDDGEADQDENENALFRHL